MSISNQTRREMRESGMGDSRRNGMDDGWRRPDPRHCYPYAIQREVVITPAVAAALDKMEAKFGMVKAVPIEEVASDTPEF